MFLMCYAFCRPSGRFFLLPAGIGVPGFCDARTMWGAQGNSSAALQRVPWKNTVPAVSHFSRCKAKGTGVTPWLDFYGSRR